MKTIIAVLAVTILLGVAPACLGADLQAGWHASAGIYVYRYDPIYGVVPGGKGWFYDTTPGQYGPFIVSDGPTHDDGWREASVLTTVGARPEQSLTMPLTFTLGNGEPIAYMDIAWETQYDPSVMALEVWQRTSDGTLNRLWQQPQGGLRYGDDQFAGDTVLDGSYFVKVAVVPEPSAEVSLLLGLIASAGYLRRRR